MGGKSFFSQLVLLYDVVKVACCEDFFKFNDLTLTKGIYIKCSNTWKNKAQDAVDFLNDVVFGGKVPFFENELRKGNKFLKNLKFKAVGTRESDLRSDDVLCFWLSELTAMKTAVGQNLISSSDSRLTSRFIASERLFTHIILDSSTTGVDSALDLFLRNDPKAEKAFKVHVNSWNTTEGLGRYFNFGSFEVYAGDSQRNPFIIPKNFSEHERSQLDKDRIIICPNELIEEAKRNIVLFLQEKAGISTNTSSKFFLDRQKVEQAFCLSKSYDDSLALRFFDPLDTLMSKLKDTVSTLPQDRRLYIRIDCGVANDLFGICVAYGDGVKRVNVDGIPTERLRIKIPIALGISRYEGEETNISKVEDFILQLNQDYEVALVLTDQYQCFTGETKISLLSGEEVEISEIVRRFEAGEDLEVLSYDIETDRFIPNKIIKAWQTGIKEICEVHLSNGKIVRCTPNHRFLLANNEYSEIRNVKIGTSLKSINGPITVTDIVYTHEFEPVYDLSMEKVPNFPLSVGIIVHNSTSLRQTMKQNGIKAELESVDRDDNAYVITKNYIYQDLIEIADNKIALKEMLELERVGPRKVDHPAKELGGCFTGDTEVLIVSDNSEIEKVKFSELCNLTNPKVLTYDLDSKEFVVENVKSCGITKYTKELIQLEFDSGIITCTPDHRFLTKNRGWVEAKDLTKLNRFDFRNGLNLISSELKSLDSEVPVYDLEVEHKDHNFTLACGAVVHNSKDIADSISGVIAKMVELGPEEVLAPPAGRALQDLEDTYSQLNSYRNNQFSTYSTYSDYL